MRIKNATGAKIKKNIIPKTKGLIILPNKRPKRIHSLLRGRSKSAFTKVITKSITPVKAKRIDQPNILPIKKYTLTRANIDVKKYPNFLLDGSFVSDKFIIYFNYYYNGISTKYANKINFYI
jgi:hypothetical protein